MALRHCLCALSLIALVAPTLADDRPPTNLHLVGDHWTAWNPPATHPPDTKLHIVQRGDTLWDLSGQYLGNPYLWPQIWEKNQYVLDAHWIYPGDPLVVGIEVAPAEALEETVDIAAQTHGAAESGAAAASEADAKRGKAKAPIPLGSESDLYCSGYIGEEDETFPWQIEASELDQLGPQLASLHTWGNKRGTWGFTNTLVYELSNGMIVYLDGGRSSGLSPGMMLMAVEPGAKVRHPQTRDDVGRLYNYRGRIRVLTVQEDRAIAEIQHACTGLHTGSLLRRFEPEPVPLARRPSPRAANDPTEADLSAAPTIVLGDRSFFTLGQDHVVYIDRGENDDVYPGDLFTIYRVTETGLPPVPVGELAVLSVQGHSALGKILESRYPIYVGDRLERR